MSTGRSSGLRVPRSRGMHRLQSGFLLLELTQHRVRADLQHTRRLAHPTGAEAHGNNGLLDLGPTPSVTVVEQKTAGDTRRILAPVARCPATGFPAFDDLLAGAVGTSDRDASHGPLLAVERCQNEAQCDINRSPSPLLEHYP